MEPQIRYATTADGVNIAYWAMGSGVPVVIMELPTSNVQFEWQVESVRRSYEATAAVATVVRFDHRGFGLSDRDDRELTTDLLVSDLEAVVDKLGLERFFLVANRGATYPVALQYAAAHPDRVIRLAAVVGGPPTGFVDAMLDTPGADWKFISEAISRKFFGWDDEESSLMMASILRESTNMDGLRRFSKWSEPAVLSRDVPPVQLPVLFIAFAGVADGDASVAQARALASSIPESAVSIMPGGTLTDRAGRFQGVITAFFTEDLTGVGAVPAGPTRSGQHGTAVVLFADIADSTALTERLGDAAFRDKARALDGVLRGAVRANGGAVVDAKTLGDGILATFPAAAQGIAAARACAAAGEAGGLPLHLGLHAGDVIREDDNVFGGTVNIAARICGLAAAGEILVSDVVRGMARSSAGVTFEDRGEREMKGVGEPVRVYAVRVAS